MKLEKLSELARGRRLYPSLILHGADRFRRLEVAVELARTVLCSAQPEERPCGRCRHCRRVSADVDDPEAFHPDVRILERDLAATTSVEATRECLRMVQQSPFEAEAQVIVVAEADTMSPEAADALLKVLEEPPESAPRHFLLLTPAREDLLPTVRSRSWTVYLGGPDPIDEELVGDAAAKLASAVELYRRSGAGVYLQAAAEMLERTGDWEDPRAERPWATVASVAVAAALRDGDAASRRSMLALADSLLEARPLRMRRIPVLRILEGLVFEHLSPTP